MKPNGRRTFLPGRDASAGVDLLESRQLLSAAGRVVDVAAVEGAGSIAESLSVFPAAIPSDAAKKARSVAVGDASVAHAGPARSSSVALAVTVGNANGSEAGDLVSHPGHFSDRADASGAVAVATGAAIYRAIEQTSGDDAGSGPTADRSAVDSARDVFPALGAGIFPIATGDVETFGDAPESLTTLMAGRNGAPVNPGAASLPANNGQAESEVGPDGASPTVNTGSKPAGVFRVAYSSPRTEMFADLAGTDVPVADGDAREPAVEGPSPLPRAADLLTEFLPFDRARLEDAIGRFLAPLEGMGSELASWSWSSKVLPAVTVVVGAAIATEVARRGIRLARTPDDEEADDTADLPGHPLGWRVAEA